MNPSEPQFLYLVLILPSLFGLTLVGEGLNKVLKDEMQGIVSVIIGIIFVGIVIFAYFYLTTNLK